MLNHQEATKLFLHNFNATAGIDYPSSFPAIGSDGYLPITEFMN
jgi:hypothetical protein